MARYLFGISDLIKSWLRRY